MCGDLSRRGPVGVQQAGGGAMRRVALVAAQRRLDCVADDRVDEARRVVARPAPRDERGRRPAAWRPPSPQPAIAAAWRSSQPSPSTASACARPARADRGRARARRRAARSPRRPPTSSSPDRARPAPVVERDRPQQLGQRTAGCRRSPSRPPRTARRSPRAADRRAHDRRRWRRRSAARGARPPTRLGRSATSADARRRRLARPQRDHQRQRQPLEPRREVGQPPQRGLVRPVRVIDGDEQRSAGGEIGGQPVQAVQDGEGRVDAPASRPRRPASSGRTARSGPGEQRLALVRLRRSPGAARTAGARRRTRSPPRARTHVRAGSRSRAPPPAGTPRRPATSCPIPARPSMHEHPAAPSNSASIAASSRSRSSSFSTRRL